MDFGQRFSSKIQQFEKYLSSCVDRVFPTIEGIDNLHQAVRYSLNSGGKRFRPLLSLLTAESLGREQQEIYPYAAAVEMIHTYSLIHDDLPLMDNDDFRRGKPTNHKVYGEAMALLAGDALLTGAFQLLTQELQQEPKQILTAIQILSSASGYFGMVGGQSLDIQLTKDQVSQVRMEQIHKLKTGALINSAIAGAAELCGASEQEKQALNQYGWRLGLAFQIADDLLDEDSGDQETSSFLSFQNQEQTKKQLAKVTEEAVYHIVSMGERADSLKWLALYNELRTK